MGKPKRNKKQIQVEKYKQNSIPNQNPIPEKPVEMETETIEQQEKFQKYIVSFTKRGDTVEIVMAAFFAFIFIFPGICVIISSGDVGGGLICMLLGLLPLYLLLNRIYAITTSITHHEVQYHSSGILKKTKVWNEPLAFYCKLTEKINNDNAEAVLWHSSDDSKNVILSSTYYKYDKEVRNKIEELNRVFNRTSFGKKQKFIQFSIPENYVETNFFDIYNTSKFEKRNLKRLLFPDQHLLVIEDTDTSFTAVINKSVIMFSAGLFFLLLSFLILPWAFKAFEIGALAFVSHVTGVLLYNFGANQQLIKAEKRNLILGQRWFKRKIIKNNSIPFADINSISVIQNTNSTAQPIYSLEIVVGNEIHQFGKSPYKQELEWLSQTLMDRIITINARYFTDMDNDNNYY